MKLNLKKKASIAIKNALIVTALGQVPPFTFIPEEGLTIPAALLSGLFEVDLTDIKKLI